MQCKMMMKLFKDIYIYLTNYCSYKLYDNSFTFTILKLKGMRRVKPFSLFVVKVSLQTCFCCLHIHCPVDHILHSHWCTFPHLTLQLQCTNLHKTPDMAKLHAPCCHFSLESSGGCAVCAHCLSPADQIFQGPR